MPLKLCRFILGCAKLGSSISVIAVEFVTVYLFFNFMKYRGGTTLCGLGLTT